MATGGTPAPIIARLDEEIAKALALPEVRDAFAKQGVEIFYMNSEQSRRIFCNPKPRASAASSSTRASRADLQ